MCDVFVLKLSETEAYCASIAIVHWNQLILL